MNIGMGEILGILVIALLVFGPNRLPEIARGLGKGLRSFQRETRSAADVLRAGLDDVPGAIDTPDAPAADTARAPEPPPAAADPAMRRFEDT